MTSPCIISAFSGFSGSLFHVFYYKNVVFSGEQVTESLILVSMGKKNTPLVITVCHHSASLMMPIGDPRDGFFYPTLILMMNFYNVARSMTQNPKIMNFDQ